MKTKKIIILFVRKKKLENQKKLKGRYWECILHIFQLKKSNFEKYVMLSKKHNLRG